MRGKKLTPASTARATANGRLDDMTQMVTRLQAKLDEAHRRADDLHHKAEQLHMAVDEIKQKARDRSTSRIAKQSRSK